MEPRGSDVSASSSHFGRTEGGDEGTATPGLPSPARGSLLGTKHLQEEAELSLWAACAHMRRRMVLGQCCSVSAQVTASRKQ